MKVIICGPSHSGKSVLIANLVRFMPSDSYLRINANGDGEGTWSNNQDQQEIIRVRTKSANTPEKFAIWTDNIKKAFQDIVIIDIGGKLQDDKIPLFEAADTFVVLSSDPSMIAPWKDFGELHGCRCIATVESYLDGGHDEIVCRESHFIHARLSGLERGNNLLESTVIKSLAELIVRISGYRRNTFIDFSKIGESIGCSMDWTTNEGIRVTHSHFNSVHGPLIYDYLTALGLMNHRCKIFGLKANWVAAIASMALGKYNQVFFFDERTGVFRPVVSIPKVPLDSSFERWIVEEGKDYVCLSQNNNWSPLETKESDITVPVLDENKPLFLSGRFPIWIVASILGSYSSKQKYLFQPGSHFYCVESDNTSELGMIKDLQYNGIRH